jgi:hypothetical protein
MYNLMKLNEEGKTMSLKINIDSVDRLSPPKEKKKKENRAIHVAQEIIESSSELSSGPPKSLLMIPVTPLSSSAIKERESLKRQLQISAQKAIGRRPGLSNLAKLRPCSF